MAGGLYCKKLEALVGKYDACRLKDGQAITLPKMTYEAQWADYRHRRNLHYILALSFALGIIVVGFMLKYQLISKGLAFLPIAAGAITLRFSYRWLNSFKCPRCANRLTQLQLGQKLFDTSCGFCGLPRWAEKGHENPQT